jgi:hypothetical protein
MSDKPLLRLATAYRQESETARWKRAEHPSKLRTGGVQASGLGGCWSSPSQMFWCKSAAGRCAGVAAGCDPFNSGVSHRSGRSQIFWSLSSHFSVLGHSTSRSRITSMAVFGLVGAAFSEGESVASFPYNPHYPNCGVFQTCFSEPARLGSLTHARRIDQARGVARAGARVRLR